MSRLEHDDRFVGVMAIVPVGSSLDHDLHKRVYVRKEDVIAAALQLALEDLPALVQQLHSTED